MTKSGPSSFPLSTLLWLVPPAALAVYLYTLTPAVGLIDSGELAAGCRLLNVLHPTGYPLYTILGRLVSLLPLGTVVTRVASLSAVLAATAVGLLQLLLMRLGCSRITSAVTAFLFAFSFPLWSVAVDVEVYALTAVLALLVWLVVQRAGSGEQGVRGLLVVAYLCGLAFTNHMSVASVVIGAGIALLLERGRFVVRNFTWFVLLFLVGLSPYVFLVLRAKAGPLLAWGSPVSLERLVWHVTGKQYQVWMFSLPFSQVLANAGRGLVLLSRSFLFVLAPLALYGAWRLWRIRRRLAIGLGVSTVLSVLYAANYSIPDIEAYYLPCLVGLFLFFGVGLEAVLKRLGRWRHVFWAVPVFALTLTMPSASRRDFFVSVDQARNTLASAGPNAVILTDWWDIYSPVFYLQNVEGVRPDVCIIDKELVRRTWYFRYLERAYPWLVERSRAEVDAYLVFLDQFEHGRLKDVAGIQRAYIRVLESFVRNSPERPAYVTFSRRSSEDARQMFSDRAWVPVGLLYALRADSVIPDFDYSQFVVRVPRQPDGRTRANLERYRIFTRERAVLLEARGRIEDARRVQEWYQNRFGALR